MTLNLRIYNDNGKYVTEFDFDNPLELIEKGIELFKEKGGQVWYKRPSKGDRFVSHTTGNMLTHSHYSSVPSIYLDGHRLTFTPPPEPGPVESEWSRLREEVENPPNSLRDKWFIAVMDKIDELEGRLRKE